MPKDEEKSGSYESTVDDTRRRRVSDPESEALTQKQVKEQLSAFQKQMDDQIVKRLEEFLNRVPRNTIMSSPISGTFFLLFCFSSSKYHDPHTWSLL